MKIHVLFVDLERCRNKSNEQPSSNDLDEQPENFFAFQPRRSYSRESSLNSFEKVRKRSEDESA
jgi:hypothetical protein